MMREAENLTRAAKMVARPKHLFGLATVKLLDPRV
jgi:hypothetical protein